MKEKMLQIWTENGVFRVDGIEEARHLASKSEFAVIEEFHWESGEWIVYEKIGRTA